MPQDPRPWRQAAELVQLAKTCKLRVVNPMLEDGSGGMKCYGRLPKYPETLEDARNRYIARVETYIQRSAETEQNFILVTHADAVAAALIMFERGGADIQDMGFCARVTARRNVEAAKRGDIATSAYKEQWEV